MSKQEQRAILAFCNSFRLSRRVTSFDQLSDGKVLLEVMSSIDASHFKALPTQSGPSSPDNWVLKTNALKRLYRLLLSYSLPPPHPAALAQTSLAEPPFSAIAKSPGSREGIDGMMQIARFCLSVAVWAPGNEKVIRRIQTMEEGTMAELMRSIEGVMATLPSEGREDPEQAGVQGILGGSRSSNRPSRPASRQPSPVKVATRATSPTVTTLRQERDQLLQDNDDLRSRVDKLAEEVTEAAGSLKEAEQERDDALAKLNGTDPAASLRTSQTSTSEMERLRSDLAKVEGELAQREIELDQQTQLVRDLNVKIEQLESQAAQVPKLQDQLDEYRHAADRLQKSENVIEKYKTKLEEQAGLRKELKALEKENAALVHTNAELEAQSRIAGSARSAGDEWRAKADKAERLAEQRIVEIADLTRQLETTREQMSLLEGAHERDKEALQTHQDRLRELELGSWRASDPEPGETLGDELDNGDSGQESKAELRSQIRQLRRQVEMLEVASRSHNESPALETELASATKLRDRYKAVYAQSRRAHLKLQADMERVRAGRGGDSSMTAIALRQGLEEVTAERDDLYKARSALSARVEELETELRDARTDLRLVDKDQATMLAGLRQSVEEDRTSEARRIDVLREELDAFQDKDRLNLEEIKRLLSEKVDRQSLPASPNGLPPEILSQLASTQERERGLTEEVQELRERLDQAGAQSRTDLEAQVERLRLEVEDEKRSREEMEERFGAEQRLMLGAWHDLGSRMVRDHVNQAGKAVKRPAKRAEVQGWLGRQRKAQEDAIFGGGK